MGSKGKRFKERCRAGEGAALLTNIALRPWGRSQDKKKVRNCFIEEPKLQATLKANRKVSTKLSWGLGRLFFPITSIRAGYSTN